MHAENRLYLAIQFQIQFIVCLTFNLSSSHMFTNNHERVFIRDDLYAHDSIELLAKSGIDFKAHEERGVDVAEFGELLISSGMVLLDEVKWISFHRYAM